MATEPFCAVRRLTPFDRDLLRSLRLRALADAPSAFGSTYEREVAFPDEEWERRLDPDGNPGFVAETADGRAVGMACGVRDDTDAANAFLMAMWVDALARGTGAASLLIETVVTWATAKGFSTLTLHVTRGNDRAERRYQRHGFVRTGATFVRDRDGCTEIEMQLTLDPDA